MDDYNISFLHESTNEWSAKLLTMLTPLIIEGYKSIFYEAVKLCKENKEDDKYLMTFQNLIQRVPKWNHVIVETEKKRIIEKTGCVYLEDLVTCVHVIQLKIMTAMRVGQKQKKIDIDIPKLDNFIHKVYIQTARKIYKNVYLFQTNIDSLQVLKNHRELEKIVQECILNTIRESVPVDVILKAYMDETEEENVTEEVKEEIIHEPAVKTPIITSPIISSPQETNEPIHMVIDLPQNKSNGNSDYSIQNHESNISNDLFDVSTTMDFSNNSELSDNFQLPDLLEDVEILE
jgi:hypothetical protein